MKKKNLKSLSLNKRAISNLENGIQGGKVVSDTMDTYFPCPADTDFQPCESRGCYTMQYDCPIPTESLRPLPCDIYIG